MLNLVAQRRIKIIRVQSYITDVELEIGGQKIDKQSGLWMETWAELTEENPTGVVSTTS